MSAVDPARVAEAFAVRPGYLNTASLGLPHRLSLADTREVLDRWERGEIGAGHADGHVAEARASYASLVGLPADHVAIGSQASAQIGIVAASLPQGAHVVTARGEFASVSVPFEAAGLCVTHAPLEQLADYVVRGVDAVAFSLVQSANGALADVAAILAAADEVGALTICDVTQAAGILPVDASLFDVTVCHTYKWLSCPRGVSFMTFRDGRGEAFTAFSAGWFAGEDVWGSTYGPGVQLAGDARRFDVSPAWFSWVGAAPALRYFAAAPIAAHWAHATALGNALCEGLGLAPKDQAIVSWPDPEGHDLARLSRAGIAVAARAGAVRASFHVWNTEDDVAAVLETLGRRVA